MGAYDGGIAWGGGTFDFQTLISQLTNDLPCRHTYDFNTGGLRTRTNTTYASLKSMSVAVEADELAVFLTQATCSAFTEGHQVAMTHFINGIDKANYGTFTEATSGGSISGQQGTITQVSFVKDVAGTIVFDLQWANATAVQTIYSFYHFLHVFQFKRRD